MPASALMIDATFLFATMGVCVKLASSEFYAASEIVMYRGLVGLAPPSALLTRPAGHQPWARNVPGMHLWRSISGVTSLLSLWFYSPSASCRWPRP